MHQLDVIGELSNDYFRYLNGTRNLGITLYLDSPLSLHCFTNVDWAGNYNNLTSTGAYIFFILVLIWFHDRLANKGL